MIYMFRCQYCGRIDEPYFRSHKDIKPPDCCGEKMVRNYTPFAIRMGMQARRTPPGMVEVGTEFPKGEAQPDRYKGVERELIQAIDSGQDWDGSGDYTLKGLVS